MDLTVENILICITEKDIFQKYLELSDIELNVSKYCNTLRADNTPGCTFIQGTSRLFFNDYAYPEYSGDCFHLVKKKQHCDFWTALRIINRDFKLGLDDGYLIEYTPVIFNSTSRKTKVNVTKRQQRILKIKTMPIIPNDVKFWSKFGIREETLAFYNVKSVFKAWVDDKYFHKYSLKEPIYAYLFNDRMKLYRPFSKKELKWRNNCIMSDIQGLEQLPEKGEILLITKSLKDVMCLYELGFNAIAPQSETPNFNENILADLKKRFKRIIVWYDNDDPGVRNSILLTEKIEAEYFNIPKTMPKDPSDFLLEFEADDLLNLLLEKNIYNEF